MLRYTADLENLDRYKQNNVISFAAGEHMDALIPGLSRKLKSGIDFPKTMSLWPCFAGGYLEHFGTYVHEV